MEIFPDCRGLLEQIKADRGDRDVLATLRGGDSKEMMEQKQIMAQVETVEEDEFVFGWGADYTHYFIGFVLLYVCAGCGVGCCGLYARYTTHPLSYEPDGA